MTADISTPATTTTSNETETAQPALKKQKTAAATSVKAVKKVDPAIIIQRREAVQKRVLRLESKLAKDRELLAKYTVSGPSAPSADEAATASSDDNEEK
jgi:hypothetical protein